jgi:hypothetical protein
MADVAPFLERHGWVGCAILGCMGVLFHALNYAPLPIKPLMKQFTGSIRWVGQKLWLWPVVGISVPILFGAGVTAMFSNAYIATAALYAAATVLLAARVVTWQETRSHANRRGIRVLVFLLAIVILATSFFWDWQTHTGIMTRLSSETNRSRYQVQLLPEFPTKDQVEVKVQKSIPKGTSAESPVKPSLAAVPLQPYDISGRRGEVLLALLNTQTESRDTLRVGCIAWIEESCVAAGRFLILFSQAGWSIDSNRVFRFDPDIPQEGMNIEAKAPRYTDKLPPHLGHWNKMDASQVTFFRAFSWMQIPVHSSGNPDMPD